MKGRKCVALICIICVIVSIGVLNCFLLPNKYELHNVVNLIFEREEVENCSLIKLADYGDLIIDLYNPKVSYEEILAEIREQYGIDDKQVLSNELIMNEYNCDSIEEVYKKVESRLLERKKVQLIVGARETVLNELISNSKFELDEDEIIKLALENVKAYEVDATLYDMELRVYCEKVLNITYGELFNTCYYESEKLIKTYLIIGAIGELEKIEVDDIYSNDVDIYLLYQELENKVYELFITAEEGF